MEPRLSLTAPLVKDAANPSNYFLKKREWDPDPTKISDSTNFSKATTAAARFKAVYMCAKYPTSI